MARPSGTIRKVDDDVIASTQPVVRFNGGRVAAHPLSGRTRSGLSRAAGLLMLGVAALGCAEGSKDVPLQQVATVSSTTTSGTGGNGGAAGGQPSEGGGGSASAVTATTSVSSGVSDGGNGGGGASSGSGMGGNGGAGGVDMGGFGGAGGMGLGGDGGLGNCSINGDCDDVNPCTDDACNEHLQCEHHPVPDPTVLAAQVAGDCNLAVCVGGNVTQLADDIDIPAGGNVCNDVGCNNGVPFVNPAPFGPLPAAQQVAGDCVDNACDGSGNPITAADLQDIPLDDGNSCTTQACTPGPQYVADVGEMCGVDGECSPAANCISCHPAVTDLSSAYNIVNKGTASSAHGVFSCQNGPNSCVFDPARSTIANGTDLSFVCGGDLKSLDVIVECVQPDPANPGQYPFVFESLMTPTNITAMCVPVAVPCTAAAFPMALLATQASDASYDPANHTWTFSQGIGGVPCATNQPMLVKFAFQFDFHARLLA